MESSFQGLPKPGSEEFKRRMHEAYEGYVNSKPSIVQNERIRPANQEFFEWLMEDKEGLEATDRLFKEAGIEW